MSTSRTQSIYFVDETLSDLDTLLAGLPPESDVVLLQPDQNGLQQMLAALAERDEIDAVHVVSHGAPGSIQLGNTTLNRETLPELKESLAALGEHLSEEADLLFYGCDVTSSEEGNALIEQIAELTGADVAASDDLTGAAEQGGDWVLEFESGQIETGVLDIPDYNTVLGPDSQLPSGLASSPYIFNGVTFQTKINGELTTSDPDNPFRPGNHWDRYLISGVENGATVTVYMGNSSTVDDYLQIERNGQLLTQNDDGGDGERSYDSIVSWTYQAGDVIRATSYSSSLGGLGTYSIYIGSTGSGTPGGEDIGDQPAPVNVAPAFTDSFGNLGTVADTTANDTNLASITGTLTATDETPTGTIAFSGGGTNTYGTLSVAPDGSFTFNPNEAAINTLAAGETASHTFSVTVSDGDKSSSKNLTVNFTGANDLPTVTGNATMPGILEDAGNTSATNAGTTVANLFGPRFSDVDNGASLKGIYIVSNAAVSSEGVWRYSTDDGANWTDVSTDTTLLANYKLQFVPALNYNGTPGALTVKVVDNNDGQSLDTADLSITVTAVNDAPVFTVTDPITASYTETDAYDNPSSWTAVTGTLSGTDVENDAVNFSIRGGAYDQGTSTWTAQGIYGNLSLNAITGEYTYTPTNAVGINALPNGETATDAFVFKINDTAGAYSSLDLTISITGANDTPLLASAIGGRNFSGEGTWTFQIPADTFTDAEGAGLAYTVEVVGGDGNVVGDGSLPAWLTFHEATRTFNGNPPADWNNAALNLKVTATDPAGAIASDIFTLNLTDTGNQPPVVYNPIVRHVAEPATETTEITFANALGGQQLVFNNLTSDGGADDTSLTFGTTVTGAEVAAAVVAAGDTTNYHVALKAADSDIVVFTAKNLGDVTDGDYADVIGAGTFAGSTAVSKVADGASPGTAESFVIDFAANGGAETTILFNGETVTVTANASAEDVANLVAAGTYSNWTATQGIDADANKVTFEQIAVGDIPDITLDDFTGTFNYAGTTIADPNTDGTGYEVFEVQYGQGFGGSTLFFDGVTTTAGAGVPAATAASDFISAINGNADSDYTAAPKDGDSTTVVLTNKLGGDATDIQGTDFSGTYTTDNSPSGIMVGVPADGGAWTYTFPENTFRDPDGDALTYTAWTIDGSGSTTQIATTSGDNAVNFNPATREFSGNGTAFDNLIEIRATDTGGSSSTVATRFMLYLNDGVDSNVVQGSAIDNQIWDGAGTHSFQIPANAFVFDDAAPDTLTFSATADGMELPAWLTIDPATGVLSGNPPHNATGTLAIVVTATETDGTNGNTSATTAFDLAITNPNDAPTLTAPLADRLVAEGDAVAITTSGIFADADSSSISYSATLADGSALPDWLTFGWDGSNLSFTGNPPGNVPYLNIKVTGTDEGGDTAESTFTLNLQDPNASSTTGALTANEPGDVTVSGATDGSINENETLTANAPTDPDGNPTGDVTYQWQVQVEGNWRDIAGTRGQSQSLTLTNDEAGNSVRVQAFYTDGGGVAESPVSDAVSVINVESEGTVEIAGSMAIGEVLTTTLLDGDGLVNVTPTYQWYRSNSTDPDGTYSVIIGATASSYQIVSDDGDRYLKVVVGYTDNQGTTYTIGSDIVSDKTAAPVQRGQVAPVASDDVASVTEAGGVNNGTAGADITAGTSLLNNDSDLNAGDTKTITEVRLGANEGSGAIASLSDDTYTLAGQYGTLTVNRDSGVYTYTVNQNNYQVQILNNGETLEEVFNYRVTDSTALSDTAKLTITINGANDAPTAVGIVENSTVVEDVAGFIRTDFILNDPDGSTDGNFALKFAVNAGRLVVSDPDTAMAAPFNITIKGDDTGTLTLSGNPSDISAWLQGNVIKYAALPNAVGSDIATLTISADDGAGFVSLGSQSLSVTPNNDAPIVDLDDDNSSTADGNDFITTFRPRGEAVPIVDGDIRISDVDADDMLASASVSITAGALDNEFGTIFETLSSTSGDTYAGSQGDIIISGNGTANITLTGVGTHADYEAVLKTIQYENANPNAYSGDRAITILVTDTNGTTGSAGTAEVSNQAYFTTAVPNTAIQVGLKVFLDGADTGETVAEVIDSSHFVASGPIDGLTPISNLSFATTAAVGTAVTNSSGFTIETANTAVAVGQNIYINGSDTGLTVSSVNGTSITASGNLSLADTDVLSFQTTAINDAPVHATTTVRVPWTPVVDLDGTDSSERDYTTNYTEDSAAVVIATPTANIDSQGSLISTVTVTLTNPLDGTNGDAEALSISASMQQYLTDKDITVTIADDGHSITLSAIDQNAGAQASDMQLGMRAIKYANDSQNPSVTPREVSVDVLNVQGETGVPATTTIGIIPVNDAPVKGGDFAGGLNEGGVYVFTNADLNSTDVDNDNGTLKYILTSTPAQGTLFRDTNNNGVVDTGEAIATVGASDSVGAINAIGTDGYFTQAEVDAGQIKYAHNGQNPDGISATGTDSFGFKVVDGMEDYAFDDIAANQAGDVTLTITETDDAPTGEPVITGTMTPGETLTADVSSIVDADGPESLVFSYQWQVNDGSGWVDATGIGHTTEVYTLAADDQGKQVRVQVSFNDALNRPNTLNGEATGTVAFTNTAATGAVTITDDGTPQAGETLTANTSAIEDVDGLGPFGYQWQVSTDGGTTWVPVEGATAKAYSLPTDTTEGAQYKVAVSFTDGRGNAETLESDATTVVAAGAVANVAPWLTATGENPTAIDGSGALFSSVVADTVEDGQLITQLTLTVTGLADGADEKLKLDGEEIGLTDTNTGTTATGAIDYTVAVSGTTATVTLTHAGLTEVEVGALVSGLAYVNSKNDGAEPPVSTATDGLRVVTLVSLQDSGDGDNTGLIGLSSTQDVGDSLSGDPSSNTAPTVAGDRGATVNEGETVTLTLADLDGTDTEQPGLSVKLASATTNGVLFRDTNGNGTVDEGETLTVGSTFTLADVEEGRIQYQHDGSETLLDSFTFHISDGLALSDADTGADGDQAAAFDITVNPVDDAPTLTATALGNSVTPVAFTEGDAGKVLFSDANADPIETDENITGLTVMISGLKDGVAEKLVVDGMNVDLTDTNSGTTDNSSVGYSVDIIGGTATVTLSKDADKATWNSLIDGLAYQNTSENPTEGSRAVTITDVTDSGGKSTDVAITSHVTATAVNDAPTLTVNGFTVAEGGSKTLSTADIVANDDDHTLNTLTYTLKAAPAEGAVYIDANGNGVQDSGEALTTGGSFSHSQLSSGKVRYQHNDGEKDDSFTLSVSDPEAASSADVTLNITRTAVNDAPVITGLNTDILGYPANSGAKTLEQGGDVVINDPDSANFDGGKLQVSITFNRDPAHDLLSIENIGTGAAQIGVDGSNVSYAGTVIGAFTGGSGTNDLVVTFNAASTQKAVAALVEAIQFTNGQENPVNTSRTVSFALSDSDGGQSQPAAVNVNIATGVTPSISIANGFFVVENSQLVTALSAVDPNGRPITFSISAADDAANNPDNSLFEIVSGNLLRFKGAPDFENPTDNGADNVYNVIVRATNDQGSYAEQALAVTVLDQEPEGSAVGDTDGPVFGFATVNGNSLVMTYTDASPLSSTNLPLTSAFGVNINGSSVAVNNVTVDSAAKTVTLTLANAVRAGQTVSVSYTDPTADDDVVALQDSAGNDAQSLLNASVNNVTPSTGGSTGGGNTGGGSTSGGSTDEDETDDGGSSGGDTPEGEVTGGTSTTVQEGDGTTKTTTTGTLGNVTVTETITVTLEGKTETQLVYVPMGASNGGAVTLPLLYEAIPGSDANTTVTLPTGVGLTSVGDRTPTGEARQLDLLELIRGTVSEEDDTRVNMLGGGQEFLDTRNEGSTLWINKIVLSTPAPLLTAPDTPVIVNGSANNASSNFTGDKLEALVIDASSLPSGTTLELRNVDFAVVIGEGIYVRGGDGANIVYGGVGSQNIVLGADDDILFGGAGDDVIGSEGGADQLFGNSGNDTLFGGAGADVLHGGADTDIALYDGNMSRYEIVRDHGKTIVRSLDRLDDIDTLVNIETIRFDDGDYTVRNEGFHSTIATLYQQVLGRQADLAGFQYWSEEHQQGQSIGKIAMSFLYSAEHAAGVGARFDGLSQEDQMAQFYEYFLGREAEQAGHEYWVGRLSSGTSFEDIAEGFVLSEELQNSYQQDYHWEFFL